MHHKLFWIIAAFLIITLFFVPVSGASTNLSESPRNLMAIQTVDFKLEPGPLTEPRLMFQSELTATIYLPLVARASSKYSCDHTFTLDPDLTIDGFEKTFEPGDVICIESTTKGRQLEIRNLRGSPSQPIVITNQGGLVQFTRTDDHAIKIQNSRYFVLAGDGAPGLTYGFECDGNYSKCVNADRGSNNLEIHHVRSFNVNGQAIGSNTKTHCKGKEDYDYDGDGQNDPITPDNFIHENIVIHDNYVDGAGDEGFYLGSNGTTAGTHSGGSDDGTCSEHPYNPRSDGIVVYDNVLMNVGRDAINVKGDPFGRCQVFNNTINRDSQDGNEGQEAAINLSKDTDCEVFNNVIIQPTSSDGGNGIRSAGVGGKIYNNLIVRAGGEFSSSSQKACGIFVTSGDESDVADNRYEIYNNTIVSPKGCGISFNHEIKPASGKHRIINNLVVDPGADFIKATAGNTEYLDNNTSDNLAAVQFVNPDNDDYHLQAGSPPVNNGTDLTGVNITTDLEGLPRPLGSGFDIGAYEYNAGGSAPITPAPTSTPTNTPIPPTPTNTPTSTATSEPPTPTDTPPSLPTDTPTPTPTSEPPTPTDTPTPTATSEPLTPTFTPTPTDTPTPTA